MAMAAGKLARHDSETRHLSPAGLALIQRFEACRLNAYLPTPDDVPTIGWGSTRCADGSMVQLGMCWSRAQADSRLAADAQMLASRVAALLAGAPTTAAQFDALVSFAYNVGAGALARSTLLKLHRSGDHDGAAAQFARWNRQGQRVLTGLTRRRAAEAALYLGEAA